MSNKYYIAHGIEWKNHKYLAKIGNRYIYTMEQLKAAKTNAGQKINQAAKSAKKWVVKKANDVSGQTAKREYERAVKRGATAKRAVIREEQKGNIKTYSGTYTTPDMNLLPYKWIVLKTKHANNADKRYQKRLGDASRKLNEYSRTPLGTLDNIRSVKNENAQNMGISRTEYDILKKAENQLKENKPLKIKPINVQPIKINGVKKKNKSLKHSEDDLVPNGGYIYLTNALIHSAAGTTWESKDHKYVEKTPDGQYIYEDDLENNKKTSSKSKSTDKQKDTDPDEPNEDEKIQLLGGKVPNTWMDTLKAHTDTIIQQHADMFKDSKTVIEHLLKDENRQAFRNTLQALTGADPTKLTDALVDKMRRQLARQYGVVPTKTVNLKDEEKTETKKSSQTTKATQKTESTETKSNTTSAKKTTLDYDKIHKVNGGKNGRRRSN